MKSRFNSAWKIQSGKVIPLCLLLFGLVGWVFLPSLHGSFIDIDDYYYVTTNAHINLTLANVVWAVGHSQNICWHPLTMWSLMLDHQFYGLKPWGFHLTNVLLHAVNTVLVFLVLRRMTKATWRSLTVAALFGLHPLRVESVAWISERKDVLSVMFWMLTLWAYVCYARNMTGGEWQATGTQENIPASNPSRVKGQGSLFYGLALVFFALGLMSKPMVVTLPCVLLLLDYWPLERWPQKRLRGLLAEKVPFFLLSATVSVVTYVNQGNTGMMSTLTGLPLSFGARLENVLVSYGRYLGKLFWPVDLCALYLHPGHWPTQKIISMGLLVLGLSVFVFVMRRRQPYLLTGWLWYLGTLVPVIGLVPVSTHCLADRYTYIPSLGILIILVWGTHQLTKGWPYQGISLGAAGGVLALVCIGLTRRQIDYWKDDVSVWRRAVAMTENNYEAHNLLGRAFAEKGRFGEAILELQEVVRLNPSFAEAYCTLGHIAGWQGQVGEAMAYYQKALAIQPNSVVAHMSLGNLLLQSGRVDEAIRELKETVRLDPSLAEAYDDLGQAFASKGRRDEAIASYRKSLEIQPDSADILNRLGLAFSLEGRLPEALAAFQRAVEIQPDNDAARNNLGFVLLRMKRVDEAILQFHFALKIQPNSAEIHNNLGSALLSQGQVEEAIREFHEALRLKPDYAEASHNLASAFERKKKQSLPPANSLAP